MRRGEYTSLMTCSSSKVPYEVVRHQHKEGGLLFVDSGRPSMWGEIKWNVYKDDENGLTHITFAEWKRDGYNYDTMRTSECQPELCKLYKEPYGLFFR